MSEFCMPSLGADMKEGKLVSWLVAEGDQIKKGQLVAEIETEKGVIEIESWQEGYVGQLIAQKGDTLPVGEVLAVFVDEKPWEDGQVKHPVSIDESVSLNQSHENFSAIKRDRIKISPVARKIVEDLNLDVGQIHPEDGKVIHKSDVESYAMKQSQVSHDEFLSTTPSTTKAHDRKFIANLMTRSNSEIPHFYLQQILPIDKVDHVLEDFNLNKPASHRVIITAVYIKALAEACQRVPSLNGFWQNSQLNLASEIHVGVAIHSRTYGLMAPAILNADTKSIYDISAQLIDLTSRVRSGHLHHSEFKQPTITLTALGDLGVDSVYGMIYPPQVALLGVGARTSRVWTDGESISIKPVVTATLAADHRAIDGHDGSMFLRVFSDYLQDSVTLTGG